MTTRAPLNSIDVSIGRDTGKLTRTVLPQANAYAIIRWRAAAADIETKLGNHSFGQPTLLPTQERRYAGKSRSNGRPPPRARRNSTIASVNEVRLGLDPVEQIVI